MLRRLASAGCAVALGLLVREGDAAAQETGFGVNHFEPSERGSDWFVLESQDYRGTVRPAVGIVGDYFTPGLETFDSQNPQKVVGGQFFAHAGAALNILGRVRFALSLPILLSGSGDPQTIDTLVWPAPTSTPTVGDLRTAFDLRFGGLYGDPVQISGGIRLWMPTGDKTAYAGGGEWSIDQHVTVGGDVGIFTYAVRGAYVYRGRTVVFAGAPLGGKNLDLAASAGVRLMDKTITIGPEIFGTIPLESQPTATLSPGRRSAPFEVLLGGHIRFAKDFKAGVGIGRGLDPAYGAPDFRGLFSIEWFPWMEYDRDEDGIADKDDACPDDPGVKTDDPKTNGCPKKPEKKPPPPEPKPEDRDGDGVPDKEDACPDTPGVKTDDPKTNGCPPDRDKDGIIDSEDACPDVPGVKTDDPKTNGCPPDNDRDKDGIPNDVDACPDEPGDPDPDPKKNGCPKASIQNDQIKIREQLRFKFGSAQLENDKATEATLQAVLNILVLHPEIKKVRIEGHTDSVGTAAVNKKLSQDRANTVVKWFSTHGVDKGRLSAKGHGPDRPIADNKTDEGRRLNRRVEFHIEQQDKAAQ